MGECWCESWVLWRNVAPWGRTSRAVALFWGIYDLYYLLCRFPLALLVLLVGFAFFFVFCFLFFVRCFFCVVLQYDRMLLSRVFLRCLLVIFLC